MTWEDNRIRNGFFIFISLLFIGCKEAGDTVQPVNNNAEISKRIIQGYNLVSGNCFTCHSPDQDEKSPIAPAMAKIKKEYLKNGKSYVEFENEVLAFLQNPSKERSKMPEMVQKYGLMPKMMFSEEDLKAVAAYIYNTPLEDKEWFSTQFEKEKEKYTAPKISENPLDIGRDLAMKTKATLGKNLLLAIQTKGTEGAIDFCSSRAIFLTDSVATSFNTQIKRVSDKNRNPINKANQREVEYIEELKKLASAGQKSQGFVFEKGNRHIGYYPIYIEQMCLQCHGNKEKDLTKKVFNMIQSKYPSDLAVNYLLGDVRGIWVVEFDKAPSLHHE